MSDDGGRDRALPETGPDGLDSSPHRARCEMFIFFVILNLLLNPRGRQASFCEPDKKPSPCARRSGNASKGFDGLGNRDHHAAEVRAATTSPFPYDTRRACCQPRGDADRMIASGSDRSYGLLTSSPPEIAPKDCNHALQTGAQHGSVRKHSVY
jgi:hypothetical protein